MSQTADTVAAPAKPKPTNVPFHLIVTNSEASARIIAKHYDLSDVRMLDSIPHLPQGGMRRGEAIQNYLGKFEQTLTLVVIADEAWVKALLTQMSGMAAMVWRSIEEQLLGGRTDLQRQLLVVGMDVTKGVRQAAENGQLVSFTAGVRVPSSWRPNKSAKSTKEPQAKRNAPKQAAPKVEGQQEKKAPQQVVKVKDKSVPKPGKVRPDRSQKVRGPRPPGNSNGTVEDLYLACKGHYGPTGSSYGVDLIKNVIKFHSGVQHVSDEAAAQRLFHTLVKMSGHGYWGSYSLVQSIIKAGAQNPKAVLDELIGHIGMIPAKDSKGEDIAQPSINQKLQLKLQSLGTVPAVTATEEMQPVATA